MTRELSADERELLLLAIREEEEAGRRCRRLGFRASICSSARSARPTRINVGMSGDSHEGGRDEEAG